MVVGTLGDAAMGPLIGAIDGLKGQIKAAMDFADNAQKASLALGQTYEQTRDSLGSTMEGLRGDINQRFGAAIAGMEAGLQGNTAGVAKLINQQQLTGTSFAATAKAMAGLEAGLNLSRDDTNALSESLIDTGAEYGISTDKLVQAIDALKATFPAQKLAGMGSEVMEAVTMLQSELGPQMSEPLNKVMNMFLDTSMEGYEKLTRLGIGGIRDAVVAGDKSATEIRSLLQQAVETADSTIRLHTQGADKFFTKVGIAEANLGQGILDFTTVADAFGDRIKQDDPSVEFFLTLENLKNEALTPFKEALAMAHPIIVDIVAVLSGIAVKVGETFKTFVGSLGSGEKIVHMVSLALIDFATVGLNTFDKFRNKVAILAEEWLPKLKDGFMSASTAIHFGLVVPLESVMLVFDLFVNGLEGVVFVLSKMIQGIIGLVNKIPGVDIGTGFIDAFVTATEESLRARAEKIEGRVDRIMMTPEKSAELLRKSLKEANNDPNLLGNKLLSDMRADLVASFEESNAIASDNAKSNESTNNKTPEIETGSQFLNETADILSSSIENILGVDRDTTTAEMLEELRIANEQRAAIETTAPSAKAEQVS